MHLIAMELFLANSPQLLMPQKKHLAVLNFPVLMNNQGAPVVSTLSAAFDAGSYRDSFAPTDFALQLNMFDHNGAHIADIPLLDTGDLFVEPVLSLPVISDFDGDGSDEAIIGFSYADLDRFYANNVDPGAFITYVFKVDSLGQSRIIYSTTGHTLRKLAVNIHDGNPVVTMGFWDTFATYETGNKLVSITANGDLVFDIPLNDRDILLSGIVSGDVDGDGSDEIVINYRPRWFNEENSGVQIFSSSGELERDIALPTLGAVDDFFGMPPILEDFNSDGILDIILHLTLDFMHCHSVRLFLLNSPGHNSCKIRNTLDVSNNHARNNPSTAIEMATDLVFSQTKLNHALNQQVMFQIAEIAMML